MEMLKKSNIESNQQPIGLNSKCSWGEHTHLNVCLTAPTRRSMIFSRSSREQVSSSVRSEFRSRAVILPSSSSSFTMLSVLRQDGKKKENSKPETRSQTIASKPWLILMWKRKRKTYWLILTFWVFPQQDPTLWATIPVNSQTLFSSQLHPLKN